METFERCPSEASNISATSEEFPTKVAKNKEKGKERSESKHDIPTSRFVLDLKLANDTHHHDDTMNKENPNSSKLELSLFNTSDSPNERPSESKTFTCSSNERPSEAHQNAHKEERARAKHRHDTADIMVAGWVPPPFAHPGHPYYPYSTFSPFYGTFNRPLGVRGESMVHKPYAYRPWSTSPYHHYNHEKVSKTYLMNLSSSSYSYERLRKENFPNNQVHVSTSLDLGINFLNPKGKRNAASKEKGGANVNQGLLFSGDQKDGSGLDLNLKL